MRTRTLLVALLLCLLALPVLAQRTAPPIVDSYDSLANAILALRGAESGLVKVLLDQHRRTAQALFNRGEWESAAAEMALFANEGDNAVGGIRKRLLDGGHHFNASGEGAGLYEPGFVIVTREAKRKVLAASTALRQATAQPARQKAWDDFSAVAKGLLGSD